MRKLLTSFLLVAAIFAVACSPAEKPGGPAAALPNEITVFAAASLTEPFTAIGDAFSKANGGVKVTFNFAGSQQLAQQLVLGAPADVFASANHKQMDVVVDSGRVEKDAARSFTRNRLVVVTPKDNPGHIAAVTDLAKPGAKLVLAAAEVPVGQYALEMFGKVETSGHTGFKDAAVKNVVSYEQDVKAVLAKVTLGEADAGVVYTSDVSETAREKVSAITVADDINVVAAYPIAAIRDSKAHDLAMKFVEYVRSPAAQVVLVRYGFISTTGNATGEAPAASPVSVTGLIERPLTLAASDAVAMATVEAPDGQKTAKGIPIVALLEKAGLKPEAKLVAFVGGDGYRKELSIEELRADLQAIVVPNSDGSLRSLVPSKGPGYSVKGLVTIEVK